MPDYFCDFCGAHAEVADECLQLDASVPGTYEQVLALAPYMAECSKCGAMVLVPRASLYTDNQHGFAVRVRPSGFRTPLYTGPLDYTLRETPLLLEFREKVLLLTHGLDDVAVELLKLKTLQANPKNEFVDVVCLDVKPDHLEMRGVSRGGRSVAFNTPIELYASLAQTVPPAVHPRGFATVDLSWLREQLVEQQGPERPAPEGSAPD